VNGFVSAALRGACPTIFTALVVAAAWAPARAWASDPSPASTMTKSAVGAATVPARSRPATSGDKRRFVWHNGQWWYYMPSGRWLVHDGTAWHAPRTVAPTAQAYQPASAKRGQTQPRYRQYMTNQHTYGAMDSDGLWGNSPRYWTYQHVLKSQ
jgi:hypothetical protein